LLFRANTFFRNFEIKGPADRVMIYGILFVSEVLSKVKPGMGRRDAEKVRKSHGLWEGWKHRSYHGSCRGVRIEGWD
jgi:hypothetical protein